MHLSCRRFQIFTKSLGSKYFLTGGVTFKETLTTGVKGIKKLCFHEKTVIIIVQTHQLKKYIFKMNLKFVLNFSDLQIWLVFPIVFTAKNVKWSNEI